MDDYLWNPRHRPRDEYVRRIERTLRRTARSTARRVWARPIVLLPVLAATALGVGLWWWWHGDSSKGVGAPPTVVTPTPAADEHDGEPDVGSGARNAAPAEPGMDK